MKTSASNYTTFNNRTPGGHYHPCTSQKFYSFFQGTFGNNFYYSLIINVLNFIPQQNYRKSGNTLAALWEQNDHFSTKQRIFHPRYRGSFTRNNCKTKNSPLTTHYLLLSITFPIIINIFVRQKK